jgi:hypothetical protein
MSPYKLQFIFTGGIANCVFWDILLLTKLSSLLRLVEVDIFSLLRFSTQEVKNLLKINIINKWIEEMNNGNVNVVTVYS